MRCAFVAPEGSANALTGHAAIALARSAAAEVHASLVLAQAPFDVMLSAALGYEHASSPYIDPAGVATRNRIDDTTLSAGAAKMSHWGTRLQSSVVLTRQDQRLVQPFN